MLSIVAAAVVSTAVALALGNKAVGPEPVLHDDSLALELVAKGLEFPTSMRFLDANSILVLQKNDGQVRLVSGGKLRAEPVLEINVESRAEQGLLGIAAFEQEVFLYFTEQAGNATRNRVYKYDWTGEGLAGGKLILDLPGEPGPYHNGGKIAIGPDGRLYAVIGDVNAGGGILDNQIPGRPPDDKSVILRVDRKTGLPVQDNPFYHLDGLEKYYAYGIRNSFGLDFDPVSQTLWMTENGPDRYDEINVVAPGFNSGWHKVVGPILRTNVTEKDLNIFDGAEYKDPVFSWRVPVGVTDIEFFDSPALGARYENNIFVGDINYGTLYFFGVNRDRTGLQFGDQRLHDLVADPVQEGEKSELSSVTVGEGFGRITDIETGPDGHPYVLSYEDGRIYRIVAR